MSKRFSFIFLLFLILCGCTCTFLGIKGNGKIKTEKRHISEFEKLMVNGAFYIEINCDNIPSIIIEGDENLLPYIETKVKNNKLIIDTKRNILPKKKIRIEINASQINNLICSGANSVYIKNINTPELNINLSGADYILLEGYTEHIMAIISGAGNLRAEKLKADNVYVSVSGAANAVVYAKNYLNASISGVGHIEYYGNTKEVKTNISGIGSIIRK